ncbi:hypothetical protein SUGI_0273020 [Cryptomeria japonica]|uniref:uncharacterized protein LOC131067470 n=1 Tax=Cryptomeria japonica TaxID=3369 RepID=UPI002408D1D2|nr:uncharacterized protein LOC131067470 [Cryptomeria japonica]GLJ16247.1 hypothetical protein SUGI_0273020 [Cryptomeria japonica]
MVAKSPPRDACHAFDKMCEQSLLLKQTVHKVDRAMARLREIQSTVRGHKARSWVTLSPLSARGYMRTSQVQKRVSLRTQESTKRSTGGSNGAHAKKSLEPFNSVETDSNIPPGEWRRWSLPAALVQQAVGEILEASNFAKGIVSIFSDSIFDKLIQDPKTPQSALNDVNLLEGKKKKEVPSVPRNNCRQLNHRQVTLGNTEHWSFNATQLTPPTKCQSVISCLQNDGFNNNCFFYGMEGLEPGSADKRPSKRKGHKVAHKFRMITPENKVKSLSSRDASSSLELHRKAEKQQLRARARAELSQTGTRVQTQMNFRTSNCADKYRKNVKAVASALVSCYTSPARSIGEQKTLLKVDQITPRRKPWISHPKPVKAIIFPNPTFIPSPSDFRNNLEKLSKKGFDTPKLKVFSSSGKENVPFPRKMGTSSTLNTPKIKEHSSLLKVPMKTPTRMIKQASTASRPARNAPPSIANQKNPSKVSKLLSPSKSKSPKHCSSLKKPTWFHRSCIALHSPSAPTTRNISLLSRHRIHSPVQPLPSLISKLPSRRKRNSSPMPNDAHVDLNKKFESCSVEEGAPTESKASIAGRVLPCSVEEGAPTESKASIAGRVLPLPPAWVKTLPMDFIKDNCRKPLDRKYVNLCVDEMPRKNHFVDRGRSISCPKQRPLKPLEKSTNFSGIGKRINIVSASDAEFSTRRNDQQSEGKENIIYSEAEEDDIILKRTNTVLRRSWSFGHENTAGGGFPFFKHVRGFMNMNKNVSNINR